MYIIGTKVDPITKDEAIAKIAAFLNEPKQHFVTTPNPEIVLSAHKNADYQTILNKAELALPDGIGLKFVSRFMHERIKERISGTDMVPEICRLAREKNLKVGLLGGLDQTTIDNAADAMRIWGNTINFASHGPTKGQWEDKAIHDKIIEELKAAAPDILFVGFGHPKQEKWIDQHRNLLPYVRLFMGCGGALDFVAGSAKRAPSSMRKAGLEWLWRLISEPKRIRRIFNAVIVFPLTVLYVYFRK